MECVVHLCAYLGQSKNSFKNNFLMTHFSLSFTILVMRIVLDHLPLNKITVP